jgi:hypothetical protein
MKSLRTLMVAAACVPCLSIAAAPQDTAPVFDSATFSGLGVRNIGSAAMSGRDH